MTGKKLYEAIHLYMMKLALIETNLRKNTTSKYHPSIAKTTFHIKITKKVPNFAARWRAICKYFVNPENKQPERRYKKQQQIKEKRHTPIREKKFNPTKSKPL
jgi:hypothetical protein